MYRAFRAKTEEFVLHPYYLKEYRGRWYIFGLVAGKELIYNLALDRISAIDATKIRYKPNHLFDPAVYFADIVGVTRPGNASIETVLLWVATQSAPYVETRPIHHSQRVNSTDETGTLFSYQLIPNYEFMAEVLRLGEAARLLSPPSLRESIGKRVARLQVLYGAAPLKPTNGM